MSAAYNFYQRIAQIFNAYNNCIESENKEWEGPHYLGGTFGWL